MNRGRKDVAGRRQHSGVSSVGGALLLGAAAGIFLPMPHRLIGLVMAFGAGVLSAPCPSS